MWARVAGVLAKETQARSAEKVRNADEVCAACALWDGSAEALAELRFGTKWSDTMEVITPGEPCWADVMRVVDAIVRREGNFLSAYLGKAGPIYTPEMILRFRGRVVPGESLTFPDDQGMYRGETAGGSGDPWDGIYDRRSAWSKAS